MKQLLQRYRDGIVEIAEVPEPALRSGGVLIRTLASAVSPGTEGQMIRPAKSSLVAKARARPDLVRRVLQKVRTEGLVQTARQVKTRLDEPVPLGYSCCGEIVAVGPGVSGFSVGDRVACAGFGYAGHAEYNFVPKNLCNAVPSGVSDAEASLVAIGAIALQGVRRAECVLGERVVVVGLGLVGNLTARILVAAGCQVIGSDPSDERRTRLAHLDLTTCSPSDLPAVVQRMTDGHGADVTIVTAASDSSEIMKQAADCTRLRGVVSIVGFVGMGFSQKPYYEKEIDVRFSMSYGPGRYDVSYEEGGHDYPFSLVRWTEGRNMAAFLDLVAGGKVAASEVIDVEVDIDDSIGVYERLASGEDPSLGIVISYGHREPHSPQVQVAQPCGEEIGVGLIGAGQFARSTLLPRLGKIEGVRLDSVCSATGRGAHEAARKFGFAHQVSDGAEVLRRPGVDAVLICTRHDQHAALTRDALLMGKHVFVEKPLALTLDGLDDVARAVDSSSGVLLVGHNRRFSPWTQRLMDSLEGRSGPRSILIRVNAGPMPPDHWHRDRSIGGGRWLAEGSHFVDLARYIAGSPIRIVSAQRTRGSSTQETGEAFATTISFEDGSVALILYSDLGDRALPKERIEVMVDGVAAVIEDFSSLVVYSGGRRQRKKGQQDKGHTGELMAFVRACRDGVAPVPIVEQFEVMCATLAAEASWSRGTMFHVTSNALRLVAAPSPGGDGDQP